MPCQRRGCAAPAAGKTPRRGPSRCGRRSRALARASVPCSTAHRPSSPTESVQTGLGGSAAARACRSALELLQQRQKVRRIARVADVQSAAAELASSASAMPTPGRSRVPRRATNRRPACRCSGSGRALELRLDLRHCRQRPVAAKVQPPILACSLELRGRSYLDSSLYASRTSCMHNDPLLQILILLAASVCVVAGVRKLEAAGDPRLSRRRDAARAARARARGRQRNDPAAGGLRRGIPGIHAGTGVLACRAWWRCAGKCSASAARRCCVTTGIVAAGAILAVRCRRRRWRW